MKPNVRIEEYKVAADTVSIGGIRWLTKWDVKVQFSDRDTAHAWRQRIAQMLQGEALAQPEHITEHFKRKAVEFATKSQADPENKTKRFFAEAYAGYAKSAQPEERNFCQRCGKRTADVTVIHTCTPPEAAA